MPPSLFQQLKTTQRLPTAPRVALRILQLVESDDSSLEEITQVISSDPALVAKIMRYINAPVFGLDIESVIKKGIADELRRRLRRIIR